MDGSNTSGSGSNLKTSFAMVAGPTKLIDQECTIRPCVKEKGLENCGHCDQYIFEKPKERIVEYEIIRERL
jgi:hypothetical protein